MTNNLSARRIAALWFPYLPTDRIAAKRSLDKALVVAAKDANALRIQAANAEALHLGLARGMALADARAIVPDLAVVMADEAADLRLLETIAQWCDRFTPFVALEAPDTLLLDVTGAAHLFGGERAMLNRMCALIVRQGLAVRAALAGTAVAARALARMRDGVIAPPGEEAAMTAALPIDALLLDPAVTHGFRRAGLKTIGQVAKRTRAEIVARFGHDVAATLDRALGRNEKPISPRTPLPDYMAEHRFADPVTNQDVVSATLKTLAETLAHVLEERGEGARALEAAFFRADGAVFRLGIETGRPVRDAKIVERLFREKLDALADPLDPGFGFDLIRLSVPRAERASPQAIAFDATREGDDEIAFLIDRLAARFGSSRILSFQPNDTHIPEAAAVTVPAQTKPDTKLAWEAVRSAGEAPRRPLRMFAKPEPIEALAEIPDGPPLRFRWRRVLHEVALAEGPERIAMEWWRHQAAQPPTRDYFRVEDKSGRRFWLYRAGLYGRETNEPRWFVHGVFA
jgi:protein ImuB